MTMDGKGETVGGITLMLKGGNSSEAIQNVHQRIEQIKIATSKASIFTPTSTARYWSARPSAP
ncbi:MAG: hypothetical protein R2825_08785 [Saprospiraceae bacterium]